MRFATDENLDARILTGLRARLPDLDIVRVQDTEMREAPDDELLEWLEGEGRILITHDVQTMPAFVYQRVNAGLSVVGVVVVLEATAIGTAIDNLELIIVANTAADFENQVNYVPL